MTSPMATADILQALRRGDLAGARELRLPGGLTDFPPEIFGLADTLEVLDLGVGHLTTLPDDMGRLGKLRVLFCSDNRFERLPPSLGDCASLSQLGFRGTGMREVPGEALPPALRWLTLTDNRIEHLPDALGERPLLQKLMLSGNRLRQLPAGLAKAENLELVRLASNGLEHLARWLLELPRLAWISWAGNPFERGSARSDVALVPWAHLETAELLGEGASGRVHRALWRRPVGDPLAVAVKLFKGAMTSDGLPEREMAACLAAGNHPHLTGALGQLVDHPERLQGLVMPLLPARWRVLAGPPSLASCSRDVYDPALRFGPGAALRIATAAAAAAGHLHSLGILHGDLYGHNILCDPATGDAVLGDFGAASILPSTRESEALQRIEVRAWGLLLGELLDRCAEESPLSGLRALQSACVDPDPEMRPLMGDVLTALRDAPLRGV